MISPTFQMIGNSLSGQEKTKLAFSISTTFSKLNMGFFRFRSYRRLYKFFAELRKILLRRSEWVWNFFSIETLNDAPFFKILELYVVSTYVNKPQHSHNSNVHFSFPFIKWVSYLESPGDNPFVPQTNLILQIFPAIRNIYHQY